MNQRLFLGILILVLAVSLAFVGCGDTGGGGSSSSGSSSSGGSSSGSSSSGGSSGSSGSSSGTPGFGEMSTYYNSSVTKTYRITGGSLSQTFEGDVFVMERNEATGYVKLTDASYAGNLTREYYVVVINGDAYISKDIDTERPGGVPVSTTYVYDPPARMTFNETPGTRTTYSGSVTVTKQGRTQTGTYRVAFEALQGESVTSAAGTFDCYKFQTSESVGQTSIIQTTWATPELGTVKAVLAIGDTTYTQETVRIVQ